MSKQEGVYERYSALDAHEGMNWILPHTNPIQLLAASLDRTMKVIPDLLSSSKFSNTSKR